MTKPETIGGGLWVVTSINQQPPPKEPPILVHIDGESIHAQSQCVWWQWSHAVRERSFAAARLTQMIVTAEGEMEPQAMCARGFHNREIAFYKAMESGNQIVRTSATTIQINGQATQITLEKQPGPGQKIPLVHKLSLAGNWRVSSVDGTPPAGAIEPIRMVFDATHAETISGCVSWFWVYQAAGDRIAISRRPLLVEMCERGVGAFEQRVIARLENSRTLTRGADGSVTLIGEEGNLTLVPVT